MTTVLSCSRCGKTLPATQPVVQIHSQPVCLACLPALPREAEAGRPQPLTASPSAAGRIRGRLQGIAAGLFISVFLGLIPLMFLPDVCDACVQVIAPLVCDGGEMKWSRSTGTTTEPVRPSLSRRSRVSTISDTFTCTATGEDASLRGSMILWGVYAAGSFVILVVLVVGINVIFGSRLRELGERQMARRQQR
jgi:hypothetical protein